MALLTRFRKTGGFLQLLQLVETTEPKRRQGLLESIAKEDPGWAQIIRLKILTPEKILGWKDPILNSIWPQIPIPLIVTLWQKSNTAQREKIEHSLPHSYRGPFKGALSSIQPVDDIEFIAAGLRLVSIVREMALHGLLNLKDVDPALSWDDRMVETQDPFRKAA